MTGKRAMDTYPGRSSCTSTVNIGNGNVKLLRHQTTGDIENTREDAVAMKAIFSRIGPPHNRTQVRAPSIV